MVSAFFIGRYIDAYQSLIGGDPYVALLVAGHSQDLA